jgi:hypothetical protein
MILQRYIFQKHNVASFVLAIFLGIFLVGDFDSKEIFFPVFNFVSGAGILTTSFSFSLPAFSFNLFSSSTIIESMTCQIIFLKYGTYYSPLITGNKIFRNSVFNFLGKFPVIFGLNQIKCSLNISKE